MIFVDEYQDATALQHEIFMSIASRGKTKLYFVGDPEQYIFSFGYHQSLIKAEVRNRPTFQDIPILKLKTTLGDQVETKDINRRSNGKIVSLLNPLNSQTQQISIDERAHEGEIIFISENTVPEVIKAFGSYCEKNLEQGSGVVRKFYLSYSNKNTFDPVANDFGLVKI